MAHRRTRRQPVIVCLEGTNGCGKTTLAHALAERWRAEGGTAQIIDPMLATDFGKQLRGAVMDAVRHDEISGDTETLAFAPPGCRAPAPSDASAANPQTC